MEYVVMDYEGEPVTIEDGEIYYAEPPDTAWDERREEYREGEIYWDSQDLEWKVEPEDEYPAESLVELEYRCWQWDRL